MGYHYGKDSSVRLRATYSLLQGRTDHSFTLSLPRLSKRTGSTHGVGAFFQRAPRPYRFASFETAARSLKVVPIVASVHDDVEIETAIVGLGRESGGSLVVMPDTFTVSHRAPIILAAARNTYRRSIR
jgi:hypothetical protein